MLDFRDEFVILGVCRARAPFLCALANAYIYIIYTCVRIASGRSLAVYAMAGATTVQAAVEKEAKGLPLGKTSETSA